MPAYISFKYPYLYFAQSNWNVQSNFQLLNKLENEFSTVKFEMAFFFLTLCFIYEILLILHVNSLKAISLWRLIKSVDIEVFSICGYPFDAVPQRLIQYWWNIWNSDKMQLNFAFGKCICRSLCVIFIILVQQSGEYNGPDHPLKWLQSIAYLFV